MMFVSGAGKVVSKAFAQFVIADKIFLAFGLGAQCGLFLGMSGFFSQKTFAVFLRNLVIIGMNLAERKKTMPVSAESCLQGRFDPGYLGEVDIPLDLLVLGRFEIELFNPVSLQHRHPGLFLVARIDKHARCHYEFSMRAAAIRSAERRRGHMQLRQAGPCGASPVPVT